MKKVVRLFTVAALAMAAFAPAPAQAIERLTIKQERMMGLPNRFFVEVRDFKADGALTPSSVERLAETYLQKRGVKLVAWDDKNPPARIIINLRQEAPDPMEPPLYLIDVNIYNMQLIQTKYEIRKGTVWHLGSYKVEPGKTFPRDVERKLKTMLRYLADDYFAANPYNRPPRQP